MLDLSSDLKFHRLSRLLIFVKRPPEVRFDFLGISKVFANLPDFLIPWLLLLAVGLIISRSIYIHFYFSKTPFVSTKGAANVVGKWTKKTETSNFVAYKEFQPCDGKSVDELFQIRKLTQWADNHVFDQRIAAAWNTKRNGVICNWINYHLCHTIYSLKHTAKWNGLSAPLWQLACRAVTMTVCVSIYVTNMYWL